MFATLYAIQEMKETCTFHFEKLPHGTDYYLQQEEITIPDCKIYSIKNGDTLVGQFFTGFRISYASFGETQIVIEEIYRPFYQTKYFVRDYKSKQEVAFLQMQGGVSFQTRYVSLIIPGKDSYHLKYSSSKVIKLFQPKTWNKFSTHLGNGSEEVIFNGKIIYPNFTTKKIVQLPLSGEVIINGTLNIVLLTCGLYLLEQEISLKDLD